MEGLAGKITSSLHESNFACYNWINGITSNADEYNFTSYNCNNLRWSGSDTLHLPEHFQFPANFRYLYNPLMFNRIVFSMPKIVYMYSQNGVIVGNYQNGRCKRVDSEK